MPNYFYYYYFIYLNYCTPAKLKSKVNERTRFGNSLVHLPVTKLLVYYYSAKK